MESEQRSTVDCTKKAPAAQNNDFSENENDEEDYSVYSDDSDGDSSGDVPRKRRKKERKVPLTEEEAERRRVLANSQERERMNRLNRALHNLRRVLPAELSVSNRRLSKIRTLRLAMSYIRGLSRMLAEDDAARSGERYPAQVLQQPPGYSCYATPSSYPPYPPPAQFQSPAAFATAHHFLGDRGGGPDEGYYSSFCSDSSFLGGSYTTPTFPYTHHHHPSMLSGSADEGVGDTSSCAVVSPPVAGSFPSPCGPPWHGASPAGSRHVHTDTGPGAFTPSLGSEDRRVPHGWECGFVTGGEPLRVSPAAGGFMSSPVPFPTPVSSHHGHPQQTGSGFESRPVHFSTPLSHHHLPAAQQQRTGFVSSDVGASPCGLWSSAACAENAAAL